MVWARVVKGEQCGCLGIRRLCRVFRPGSIFGYPELPGRRQSNVRPSSRSPSRRIPELRSCAEHPPTAPGGLKSAGRDMPMFFGVPATCRAPTPKSRMGECRVGHWQSMCPTLPCKRRYETWRSRLKCPPESLFVYSQSPHVFNVGGGTSQCQKPAAGFPRNQRLERGTNQCRSFRQAAILFRRSQQIVVE